eukprot:COSAG02_NODE_2526_length_8605_cov_3.359746_5_plen_46_part_00
MSTTKAQAPDYLHICVCTYTTCNALGLRKLYHQHACLGWLTYVCG